MTRQELLDREEIRVLQNAYNIAGDRGRAEDLSKVFAEDGVLQSRAGESNGREAIVAQLSRRTRDGALREGIDRPMEFVRHNLTTSEVTFDSATEARGRTYFIVYSEIGPDHQGVYVDRYRKIDGAWKITHRQARIDWVAEGGHSIKSRKS